jgi:hypothetical protein
MYWRCVPRYWKHKNSKVTTSGQPHRKVYAHQRTDDPPCKLYSLDLPVQDTSSECSNGRPAAPSTSPPLMISSFTETLASFLPSSLEEGPVSSRATKGNIGMPNA